MIQALRSKTKGLVESSGNGVWDRGFGVQRSEVQACAGTACKRLAPLAVLFSAPTTGFAGLWPKPDPKTKPKP